MTKSKFKLSEEVWRVQRDEDWTFTGPATISAVVMRENSVRYLLTWPPYDDGRYYEIKEEQDGADLYRSSAGANREANRRHNNALRRRMRKTA